MKEPSKIKKVVGLEYSLGSGLPQITLKGAGHLADELLLRRDKLGQPKVIKDAALTEQLYRLPIDSQIGPELFRVVAVVLAHVLSINAKARGAQHD